MDLTSEEGKTILAMHFISQSAPDIHRKLQKLEKGPQTPQSELTNLAFKVFNNWDENRWREKRERDQQRSQEQKQSFQMTASEIGGTFQDKT